MFFERIRKQKDFGDTNCRQVCKKLNALIFMQMEG